LRPNAVNRTNFEKMFGGIHKEEAMGGMDHFQVWYTTLAESRAYLSPGKDGKCPAVSLFTGVAGLELGLKESNPHLNDRFDRIFQLVTHIHQKAPD
jgi:hypothetical protein